MSPRGRAGHSTLAARPVRVVPVLRGGVPGPERKSAEFGHCQASGLGAPTWPKWLEQFIHFHAGLQGKSKLSTIEERGAGPWPGPPAEGSRAGALYQAQDSPRFTWGPHHPASGFKMREQLFKPLGGPGDKEVQ